MQTRTVFTSGQAATICGVAPRTISKWFDSDRLKGYRLPGSQDRRIPKEDLIDFLHSMNMQASLRRLEEETTEPAELLTTRLQESLQAVWDEWKAQSPNFPPECITIKNGQLAVDFRQSSFVWRTVAVLMERNVLK